MNYYEKYLKYKKKYLDFKNKIGGAGAGSKLEYNKDKIMENLNVANFNVMKQKQTDIFDLLSHTTFPKHFVFIKKNWKVGDNNRELYRVDAENKYTTGSSCTGVFDLKNKSWCYLFVTDLEQTLKKLKEIYDRLKDHYSNDEMINLLIKEYQMALGLFIINNETNDFILYDDFYVVEIDSANKLFRPCYDREINDNKCELYEEFMKNYEERKKTDPELDNYLQWLNNFRLTSELPFTSLGYTFNFSPNFGSINLNSTNENNRGLDELVVKPKSTIKINGVINLSKLMTNLIEKWETGVTVTKESVISILDEPLK